VTAYFSGHYCTYGVKNQAMCDADCRFTFFSLAAPGKTNDNVAINKTSLPAWLQSLPLGYFIAADCAYSLTEHLVTPYSGPQRFLERNDNLPLHVNKPFQLHIQFLLADCFVETTWFPRFPAFLHESIYASSHTTFTTTVLSAAERVLSMSFWPVQLRYTC